MIQKWLDILSDHKISMRERMFRIVTLICMIALVFTLPMGRSILNIVILVVSLTAIAMIVKISVRKACIQTGATAIVVLLLVLFPFTFFSAGGFYSGVPEWFVLCFILCLHHLAGKAHGRVFRIVHGGDAALLWHRLLFPGGRRPEHPAAVLL